MNNTKINKATVVKITIQVAIIMVVFYVVAQIFTIGASGIKSVSIKIPDAFNKQDTEYATDGMGTGTALDENGNPITDDSESYDYEASEAGSADFIIWDSDSRYLEWSDLENLSQEELRLARNEIYAREGRRFDDEELQAYFDSKDWYEGTISSDDFSDDMLNDYEYENINLIVEYETEMGYR
jgi:hypothetical protein